MLPKNYRENSQIVTSFRGMAFVPRSLGGPWIGWIDPAPVQKSGCCLGVALSWLGNGLVQDLVVFSSTIRFFVNSHLDHSRAWIPACSPTAALCTAAFPPIFLQLRKGHLWSCAELLQSYALCSSDQCRTVKLRLPAVRKLFWGMFARGDCGWRGINVSGSRYNEVLALEVRTVVWLRLTKETCKASCVCNGSSRVRCHAVVPGVLACVHMYILYVCVYICVCVYVCGHVYMYIYACVCVFVHLCVYTHVYVYVYAYLCIDCESQYQCFSVWTVSCMCMCVRVHMYVYAYVCNYIHMCTFFAVNVTCTLQVLWALVHGQVGTLHKCVFTPTYTSANTLCTYVYMNICVYMHAYAYGCVCASMILFDTLRRCWWDFLSVHTCAYPCVCICMCMYVCLGACVYVCICIYVCLCICMHIHLCTRACGCTYVLV